MRAELVLAVSAELPGPGEDDSNKGVHTGLPPEVIHVLIVEVKTGMFYGDDI